MKTLLALLIAAPLALAQDTVKERPMLPEMQKVYERLETAYEEKKLQSIVGVTTRTFEWEMPDGEPLDRKESEAMLKELVGNIEDGNWELQIKNILQMGSVMTIVVETSFEGTMLDPADKPYKATLQSKERHHWARSADGWHLTKIQVISQAHKSGGRMVRGNVENQAVGAGSKAGGG